MANLQLLLGWAWHASRQPSFNSFGEKVPSSAEVGTDTFPLITCILHALQEPFPPQMLVMPIPVWRAQSRNESPA